MIKSRTKKTDQPQFVDNINFLNPKSPKTFSKRLKEWIAKRMGKN